MNDQEFIHADDAYADAIFRHCLLRVYDRERARDITQETFVRTWDYLVAGKPIENIRAFLSRVANNLIIDASRQRKTTSLDRLHENGFDPQAPGDAGIHDRIDADRVLSFLWRLNEGNRNLILMRYIDEHGNDGHRAVIGPFYAAMKL